MGACGRALALVGWDVREGYLEPAATLVEMVGVAGIVRQEHLLGMRPVAHHRCRG